jgi:hypothetical protein
MEPRPDPDREARLLAWREGRNVEPSHHEEEEELRCLRIAMGGGGSSPPAPGFVDGQPIRAGYRLVAEPGGRFQIEPSFACALAAGLDKRALRRLFDHLWGVDLALWSELETSPPAVLAERWLRSPGRRLVRDPAFLSRLHASAAAGAESAHADHSGETSHGASDLGLDALWAASGAEARFGGDLSSGGARWRDLHAALPGEAMSRWVPKRGDDDVATAFARLERGSPYSLRGAAIAWLLGRAVDRPRVELAGVRQDLREILPARLALALQSEGDASEERFAARLEEATLLHAAWIARRDTSPGRIRRAWHLARWIHGCLIRSPFVASDEERLHAELVALLPANLPSIDVDDPLHPARFAGDGFRIEDLALISGLWAHYSRPGGRLTPTPAPLVRELRSLAGRTVRPPERDAEESLARARSNELGWNAPHIAPPWVARWLLTEWRLPWLAQVGDEVVSECLNAVAVDPRFEWLTYVWSAEAAALSDAIRHRGLAAWRALSARPGVSPHAVASMATGLLRELEEADRETAVGTLRAAKAEWRPFLWDAWAETALQHGLAPLAEVGLAGLRALTDAHDLDPQARLNAALLLLRRAAALRGSVSGDQLLAHLRRVSAEPPFSNHQGLQRELRRLGVR